MKSNRLAAFVLLGAATVGAGYLYFHHSSGDGFANDRIRQVVERRRAKVKKQLEQRTDQPDAAMAYYVNRRTGGWVRQGTRGYDPKAIGVPLDSKLYVAALQQARGMQRYSTATGTVLSPASFELNAAAGGTLGTWEALGPNNQGGRTRQLLVNPTNPNIMYAAAVSGGVWKSTNAGASWVPLTDLTLPNLAATSLAFEPGNYDKIYVGTGEGFFNFDAIQGAGIFVTTDAGASWSQLAGTNNSNFQYVNDIVVSPRNKQRIYAATRAGVYRSIDGGATFTQIATGVNGCGDLALQTNRTTGYLFAGCGFFTATGDVKRILDSNAGTMTSVFTTTNMSRTVLAIAPSNESIVYAMATNAAGGRYQDAVLGVYRSTANGGSGTWTTQMSNSLSTVDPVPLKNLLLTNPLYAYNACVGSSRGFYNQGWYDAVLAVDPADPNRIWAGGIDLFRSDDGGANFGIASHWWRGQGHPNYAHADNHVITFHPGYNGTTNKTMYVASDGGIFRTDDARANTGTTVSSVCGTTVAGAVTWTELNTNYSTTQFYHGTTSLDGTTFQGGMQDNGTWRGTAGNTNWTNLLGGDGGYNGIDGNVLFAEYTGLSIQKSIDNGTTWNDAFTGISGDAGFAFIAPFHMNPGNRQILWSGGWYVWRTTNQATSWSRASNLTPGNGSVSAIASSNLDLNKAVFGLSDGYIGFNTAALTATATTNWTTTRPRANESVTALAYDPQDSSTVWATYGTFSGNSVYKSTNSGASWTPVPGTGANTLPAVPATAVVVDPTNSNRIYVGTDIGVFTTIDGGTNWYKEVTGFANAPVEWLEINPSGTRRLYAFTHGRGAWRVNLIP